MVAEAPQKVQITISARDADSAVTNTAGAPRAPNVNVKTPIVVKRTEPGKPPTVSSLTTKPSQQVGGTVSTYFYSQILPFAFTFYF